MKRETLIKICSIALIIMLPVLCQAQRHLKKANTMYDNLAYAEAVPEYEKALEDDSTNAEAIFRLAHCYRLINNSVQAEKWYAKAVQLKEAKPSHFIFYTEALMNNGKYKEAEKWLNRYREVAGADSRTNKMIESIQNINILFEDSTDYSIEKLSINSTNSDCSPVYFNNGIIFSSSRIRNDLRQRIHNWTDLPYYTLYFAKGKNNDFKTPEVFAPSITTKFNNATICFTKDEKELYLTRNNIEDGVIKKSDSGVVKLSIYHYKKSGSKWVEDSIFKFNNVQYNYAHPYLSPDGNRLFFSSDMPGGFGGMDLYVCDKKDNVWSAPVNLGSTVNSPGNDCFPFIDAKENLYYASNGKGGLGGYDIYFSSVAGTGFNESTNMGFPINTSADDFGYIQNENGKSGYFSSNREERNQNDDIYYFQRSAIVLNLLVYDVKTKLPLEASTVQVLESGRPKGIYTTNSKGTLNMFMSHGKNYSFIADKEKYVRDSARIETGGLALVSENDLSIALKKSVTNVNFTGVIYDNSPDKKPVGGVTVILTDKETGKEYKTTTRADGTYSFENLTLDSKYNLEAKNDLSVSYPVEITLDDLMSNKTFNNDLVLNKELDVVKLDNILYDLNKADIRPDAAKVLDQLVVMMKSNPGMKIELRSHTDCRQSDSYNMSLSNKRAKSAMRYLEKNGIAAKRLTAKGFGESMPINKCDCEGASGTPCKETQHQTNRRTEFKITSLNSQTN